MFGSFPTRLAGAVLNRAVPVIPARCLTISVAEHKQGLVRQPEYPQAQGFVTRGLSL